MPEGVTTTRLLESFRKACALIVDEYGELEGLVTLTDVLTSIVGEPDTVKWLEPESIPMKV